MADDIALLRALAFKEAVDFIDNHPSGTWGAGMVAARAEAARRIKAAQEAASDPKDEQ